ncbi:MAG: AmmeMemoRadiSam system protein B [Sedimenticola sp.]|nr:MAG: AmmeMemoRadiSam system protein B [Sedimenticola sp.]
MTTIRRPAVAGMFYPGDPAELRAEIQQFLAQAKGAKITAPKALIAPHAGYIYSGPIAANAYALLNGIAEHIQRVILLAPAHRMAFSGLAASAADRFQTPLGDIEVDKPALRQVLALDQVNTIEQAFDNEHSIEVHLPFLQEMLPNFRIVPLLVGDASAEQVDEVLEILWGGDETLIVISSDLSHFLDYATARQMDAEATRAIESLEPEDLSYNHACGRIPIKGLLLAARHHHLKVTTLDLRNSGDTAGPRNQVVGYGAYAFS